MKSLSEKKDSSRPCDHEDGRAQWGAPAPPFRLGAPHAGGRDVNEVRDEMEAPSKDVLEIADWCLSGNLLKRKQAERLCEVKTFTPDYWVLKDVTRQLAYRASDGTAEVHGQIGIDADPCSRNCEFCSFAAINSARPNEKNEMPLEQILAYAHDYYDNGANCLTLMITADYDFDQYLGYVEAVHRELPDFPIMANMDDFDVPMAEELKSVGVGSVYHATRMGEGVVNTIPLERRVRTIEAAHEAGLKVSTCVEMIGPQYTDDEILDMFELSISLRPEAGHSGGMIQVPGTKMYGAPKYSWARCDVYGAIYRMMAGTEFMRFGNGNMEWAEVGTNPRDDKSLTEAGGMGTTLRKCRLEFENQEWKVPFGPSDYWK